MDDVQNDASKRACIGGTGTKMCQVPWRLKFDNTESKGAKCTFREAGFVYITRCFVINITVVIAKDILVRTYY